MKHAMLAVRLLVVVLGLGLGLAPASAPAATPDWSARFTIGRGTSQEDVDYVTEAVGLAERYLAAHIGFTMDDPVTVSIRATADPDDPSTAAYTSGRSIVVYTASGAWRQSDPAARVAVVVHEYTHIYQNAVLGRYGIDTASWFEEGFAEYVGAHAIVGLGLVTQPEADRSHAYSMGLDPPDYGLDQIEDLRDYQAKSPTVYDLSYFAVSRLFTDRDLSEVAGFYGEIADGARWQQAFRDAFGESPDRFYDEFEAARADLPVVTERPAADALPFPTATDAKVRVTKAESSVSPGDQTRFMGRTTPQAVCRWQLAPADSPIPILSHLTFADGVGRVFWLLTLPDDLAGGESTVRVDCGGDPVTRDLEIAA